MCSSVAPFLRDIEAELDRIRQVGLYRTTRTFDSPQGNVLRWQGVEKLNFCSNDYLGLANHPALRLAVNHALDHYGLGSGASQLVCGRSSAHVSLENALAEFTKRDKVLLFSTGYQANLSVATALGPGRRGYILGDRLNHASLIDAAVLSRSRVLRYRHANEHALEELLVRHGEKQKLVLTDSVFSIDGDIAPLEGIATVCRRHAAMLVVDDAHGFAVLGATGRGALEGPGLSQADVPVMVGTFGKALGGFGAFVAGPEPVIDLLIQKARPFIYTTALPAIICAAVEAALVLVQKEYWRREKLFDLIRYFRTSAAEISLPIGASETPIQPLIIGDASKASELSDRLFAEGILVTAIRPPTVPRGTSRLRITFSATHTLDQVDRLLAGLLRHRVYWEK